mgnify:CR=1 FL=1
MVAELVGVLVVGTWSVVDGGAFPKSSVWFWYGRDYLFVPLVLALGLGALLWLGLGNNPYSQDEAVAGRTLPAWQSDDLLGGAPIHTAALKGEPFVLNVWASWCPNCRAEHPLLGDLASAVPLYGLNYRDKGDAARAWLTTSPPWRRILPA